MGTTGIIQGEPAERARPARPGNRLTGGWLLLSRTAWSVFTLILLAMLAASIPIEYAVRYTEGVNIYGPSLLILNIPAVTYARFRTFMDISLALIYTSIGIVIFLRKSDSRIITLTSIANQTFGTFFVPTLTYLANAQPFWSLPVHLIRAVGIASGLIVFLYLIPDGRFVPGWTRWSAAAWILVVSAWLLFPDLPANIVSLRTWMTNLGLSFAIIVAAFGSGIYAQVYRYRRTTDPIQRQQTKWFVFGTAVGLTGFIFYYLPLILWPEVLADGETTRLLHLFYAVPVYHLMILVTPLSIAVSVLRYRLWDIDHFINRAIIAGTLTLTLGVLYFGAVILLGQFFLIATGKQQDQFAIALSTLAIATLFFPLRSRVQDLIDRRFYKKKYTTEQTLTALSASLREEVDIYALLQRLVQLVQQAIQPASISIWLVQENGQNSPDFSLDGIGSRPPVWIHSHDPIVAHLIHNHGSVEIDPINLDSAALHAMRADGVKVTVPLISQGRLIGLLNLGPRLSEQEYSVDDFHLLTIIAGQAAPALRVAELVSQQQKALAERERSQYEMKVARLIQQNFLPKNPPEIQGWEIAASYQPAVAVGGDFFDFQNLPDGCLGIMIGDVSGHGVPAALEMINITSILREAARQFTSPAAILERANQLLSGHIPASMFITCLYGVLEPGSGRLVYSNAGHNPPLRRVDGQVQELYVSGFPLGIMEDTTYQENETIIAPGEVVLFFSDGLLEAHDAGRRMFGAERLRDIVLHHHSNAQGLVDHLQAEMSAYIGETSEQEDDVTIVTVHRFSEDNPSPWSA